MSFCGPLTTKNLPETHIFIDKVYREFTASGRRRHIESDVIFAGSENQVLSPRFRNDPNRQAAGPVLMRWSGDCGSSQGEMLSLDVPVRFQW